MCRQIVGSYGGPGSWTNTVGAGIREIQFTRRGYRFDARCCFDLIRERESDEWNCTLPQDSTTPAALRLLCLPPRFQHRPLQLLREFVVLFPSASSFDRSPKHVELHRHIPKGAGNRPIDFAISRVRPRVPRTEESVLLSDGGSDAQELQVDAFSLVSAHLAGSCLFYICAFLACLFYARRAANC